MKRAVTAFFIVCTLILASGCSTLADARAARGEGTTRIYDRPYDQVWMAAISTVRASGLALIVDNRSEGLILAQGAAGAFSWGENVAIYVEDAGGKVKTRVEIINKRALATNITAPDWESRLFRALDTQLTSDKP